MSLKKSLKTGQAVVEYFIIFAAIGAVTLIGFCSFFQHIRSAAGTMYRTAILRMK